MTSTGITLDTPSTGGPPKVKFDREGDYVDVGIVNVDEFHQHTMKGEPLYWDEARTEKKMAKRVTGLVVASNNAYVTVGETNKPAEPGELVTFYCDGGRHFTWKEAVADLSERILKETGKSEGVQVGDYMRWKLDRIEPASQRGYDDRKVQVARIRRPKPEDGNLAERCVAKYHELQNRPSLDAPSAPSAPLTSAQVAETFGAVDEPHSDADLGF